MASVISGGELARIAPPNESWAYADRDIVSGAVSSWYGLDSTDVLTVWKSQPSIRKVVDFIANAVASTPLKVYRRVSDTDRQRVTDHPLASVLRSPAAGVTPFRFWHSIVVDWLLFDRWCVLKLPSDRSVPLDLVRVQASRVVFDADRLGRIRNVIVDGDKANPIGTADCMLDHGYSPLGANGTTPMQTLAQILAEATEAVEWRRSVWRNGARVPTVIERALEAGLMTPEATERLRTAMAAYRSGGGSEGGTPILQEGMKLTKVDAFTPRDTMDIEGRQLNDAEVASAYHIAPELVGAREGTFSNVQAYRQMLYRDGLGSMFVAIEQVINAMLVPDFDDSDGLYVEADISAKLRGSFEEQAAILSTSTGAPWITRNEARGLNNLPAVAGGDTLVTPLNVLIGGQASPRDSGSQNRNGRDVEVKARVVHAARVKADASDEHAAAVSAVLTRFFEKQRAHTLAALSRKADTWWDSERWDSELSDDLFALAMDVTKSVSADVLDGLGVAPDQYDPDRTVKFLRAVSDSRASMINAATRDQIASALDDLGDDETPHEAAAHVFDVAETSRADKSGLTLATTLTAFAVTEAAKQVAPTRATKTWVTGGNPRPEHAAMDGETVGIDEAFSNGAAWPGDPILGADGVAGCNCTVVTEIS